MFVQVHMWHCRRLQAAVEAQAEARAKAAARAERLDAHAAAAAAAHEEERLVEGYAAMLRERVAHEVMPSVCKALIEIVAQRPEDPIGCLSRRLLEEADKMDRLQVDPYDAPVYGEKRHLVAAHEAREAARASAREAKAQAEEAERRELDEKLRAMLLQSVQKHESMMRS
jgi:hypothetical protein